MATLHIRNVPEALYQHLRKLAAEEHRSLNAQVITLLSRAVKGDPGKPAVKELLHHARQIRGSIPEVPGIPDSVELLRQGREERVR